MAQKDRLVGADATLKRATFGAPLVTGTATEGAWYKIAAIDGATVFPAGYEVGDLWLGDGVAAFTATNSASLATFTEVADVTSFTLEFSKDEIEVTVLADDVKKYRAGKADLSGSMEGINRISEMRKAGSFVNRFLRVVVSDENSAATLNPVDGSELYCQFMIQKDETTLNETHGFLFAQVELFGTSLGAAIADAQSWTSNVRVLGNDPILYFKDNPTA